MIPNTESVVQFIYVTLPVYRIYIHLLLDTAAGMKSNCVYLSPKHDQQHYQQTDISNIVFILSFPKSK